MLTKSIDEMTKELQKRTTRAETLVKALKNAYEMIETIDWPEGFYRKDIGWRAL